MKYKWNEKPLHVVVEKRTQCESEIAVLHSDKSAQCKKYLIILPLVYNIDFLKYSPNPLYS